MKSMTRLAIALVVVVVLASVPWIGSDVIVQFGISTLLLAVLAQGWNIIGGYTGYASFGNSTFFGLGAYGVAIAMVQWNLPFWVGMVFGAAMAGIDGPLALAVSGGGDSLALMHLAARHAAAHSLPVPVVLTVDHGLRKGSRSDARKVVAWAKAIGLKAHILSWPGKKPKTGVEAAARSARYRLMGAWMAANGVSALCVGHTQDDQAETFLLRLARGSGVDGLAAMRALAPWPEPGFARLRVVRPLLALPRADLRGFLSAVGQDWLDDPMNQDPAFDRVRLRGAAQALAAAGLSAGRIAAAAAHLARARAALEQVTEAVLARAVRPAGKTEQDGLLLDAAALGGAPREVGLRALAAVLMAVSGAAYRPRFEALERLFDRIAAEELGGGATLMGCRVGPARRGTQGGDGARMLLVRREGPRRADPRRAGRGGSKTAP